VYNAYLYCVTEPAEKALLDQLIKSHVEFTKFKEQGFDSFDYDEIYEEQEKQCGKLKDRL